MTTRSLRSDDTQVGSAGDRNAILRDPAMDARPELIHDLRGDGVDARRDQIEVLLAREGRVRVADLARHFRTSAVTIRNDLAEMERAGRAERVHGGAVSTNKSYYAMTDKERMETHVAEKRAIAAYAASLVNEGDTLFVSSGTTCIYLAMELKRINNILVITNSPYVAQEYGYTVGGEVVLLGGNYSGRYHFTYGDDALMQLGRYRADTFFLSCDGIDAAQGVTLYHHLECDVSRRFMERARLTVAIADASKIGRVSRVHLSPVTGLDMLVTNEGADPLALNAIREEDVDIVGV